MTKASTYILGFTWVMDVGQWPGRRDRQKENWSFKEMPFESMTIQKSLQKFEGYIKVGHVDAPQKNPLPGLEVIRTKWISQCTLKWPPESMKGVDIWGPQQYRELNLDIFLLHSLGAQNPNKRDRGYLWLWGRFLRGKAPHIAGK